MPFSEFLKNIEDGRVIVVKIQGNDIEGLLSDGKSLILMHQTIQT